MARKKKKRKKRKESGFQRFVRYLKGGVATSAIIVLSALGLWRCLDGEHPDTKKGTEKLTSVETVDVGQGNVADPTLVNEERLLKEEAVEEPAPDPEPKAEQSPSKKDDSHASADRFPLFGVAFHFHTQLKAAPSGDARVIGYARRGATFRLSEQRATDGCKRGWYEIAPGGLFVCNGEGVIVDDEPVTFAPSPPQPRLDQSLPYQYAYANKDNTPEYWRIPTEPEAAEVTQRFERIALLDSKETPSQTAEAVPVPVGAESGDPPAAVQEVSPDEVGTPAMSSEPHLLPDAGPLDAPANELPPFVHLRMAKGYFVSVDEKMVDSGREFRRTVRGRFIPEENLYPAKPSDFEGFLVDKRNPLPRAFVVGSGVNLLRRQGEGGPLLNHEKVKRYAMFDHLGEMVRRNRRYHQVGEGLFLSARVTAVAKTTPAPSDIQENERWIHVDLSEQTLVAYEGERPVFATLVSTGRPGFETPTGSFRIYGKHITVTMDDTDAKEEAYSIEDVPWVQYFKDSFALHAAFWHDRFGRVRSHGCVNLTPKDAMRLFKWTGPAVPKGVHGIFATKENPGTRVIIAP